MVGVAADVWSSFGGPTGCRAIHASPEGAALPVEACLAANHVRGEHFGWNLFERLDLADPGGRLRQSPTDCSASLLASRTYFYQSIAERGAPRAYTFRDAAETS